MSDVTASFRMLLHFIGVLWIFLYITDDLSFQTFTDCVSNQYTHQHTITCYEKFSGLIGKF